MHNGVTEQEQVWVQDALSLCTEEQRHSLAKSVLATEGGPREHDCWYQEANWLGPPRIMMEEPDPSGCKSFHAGRLQGVIV